MSHFFECISYFAFSLWRNIPVGPMIVASIDCLGFLPLNIVKRIYRIQILILYRARDLQFDTP